MSNVIEIAQMAPDCLAEAGSLLEVAFGQRGMSASMQAIYQLAPEHWYCSRQNGLIIGMVGAYGYHCTAADSGSKGGGTHHVASIGMMCVHPMAQGAGIGYALMTHLVAQLDAAGFSTLFLESTQAGTRLYPRLGFQPGGETLRMVRHADVAQPFNREGIHGGSGGRLEACADSPAGTPMIRPLVATDLPAVAAFDRQIFGMDRLEILRWLHGRFPGRSFVAEVNGDGANRTALSENRIGGYVIAGRGAIGPWAAADGQNAERLLREALSLEYDDPPRVTLPAGNTLGRALLARYGFVATEGLTHMRRGGSPDPRRCADYYGQASLALG